MNMKVLSPNSCSKQYGGISKVYIVPLDNITSFHLTQFEKNVINYIVKTGKYSWQFVFATSQLMTYFLSLNNKQTMKTKTARPATRKKQVAPKKVKPQLVALAPGAFIVEANEVDQFLAHKLLQKDLVAVPSRVMKAYSDRDAAERNQAEKKWTVGETVCAVQEHLSSLLPLQQNEVIAKVLKARHEKLVHDIEAVKEELTEVQARVDTAKITHNSFHKVLEGNYEELAFDTKAE